MRECSIVFVVFFGAVSLICTIVLACCALQSLREAESARRTNHRITSERDLYARAALEFAKQNAELRREKREEAARWNHRSTY